MIETQSMTNLNEEKSFVSIPRQQQQELKSEQLPKVESVPSPPILKPLGKIEATTSKKVKETGVETEEDEDLSLEEDNEEEEEDDETRSQFDNSAKSSLSAHGNET